MHALSLIFILVALGFNESSSGFGCQIYPDSTANEFPKDLNQVAGGSKLELQGSYLRSSGSRMMASG